MSDDVTRENQEAEDLSPPGDEAAEIFGEPEDDDLDFGDEEDDSSLFPDGDESAAGEEADADEPDDGQKEGRDGAPKGLMKRLRRLVAQRNEVRQELEALRQEVAANEPLLATLKEKYGRFENPAAQLKQDAEFMDAVEELAKSDSIVRQAVSVINQYLKTGAKPVPEQRQQSNTSPAEAKVQKLLERAARDTIEKTLSEKGVRPAFRRLIARSILSNDKVDLAELDERAVIRFAREFVRDAGFDPKDLLEPRKADGSPKPAPGTGRAATSEPAAKKRAAASAADSKSERELNPVAKREKVLAEIVADVFGG